MDVQVLLEGGAQPGIAGQVGHDAQLDLAVVRSHQPPAGGRHECLAHPPPLGGADRDVLQVRVLGGQPPGGRHGLMVGGMHPPGVWVDLPGQLVRVGGFQLGERPVFDNDRRQFVAHAGQVLQHQFLRGGLALGRLLQDRQAQLVVEDLLQLLGAVQIELAASQIPGLGLQPFDALRQFLAVPAQEAAIHGDAVALHAREQADQGPFDVLEHPNQGRRRGDFRPQGLMQPQADVRIFRRILGGLVQGNLIEAQLLPSPAGHILVANGLQIQVLAGQLVHVVLADAHAVEDVGFQHAVVGDAGQFDAGPGQHAQVVLEVVAQLGLGRVRQQRPELGEHGIEGKLLRGAGIAVAEGDVGGLAGLHGEGEAHQIRLHVVQAGGFRVEGDERRLLQARRPGGQALGAGDAFVASLRRFGRRPGRCIALQFRQPSLELALLEQGLERLPVRNRRPDVVQAKRQIHIALDGGERPGQRQLLQAGPQILADLALDFAGPSHQFVQRAVFVQPFGGGLGPHFGHAGDIVGDIPHQRQIVQDPLRRHAVLADHSGPVQFPVGHGVQQPDMGADQLRHVLVAGGNDGVAAGRGGLAGQRADDIVRLHSGHDQQRHPHSSNNVVDGLNLLPQILRHGGAVGLVFGIQRLAEGLALGVEDCGDGAAGKVLDELAQHSRHTLDGAGGATVRSAQGGQRVIGAKQIGGAIHQNQGVAVCHRFCHCSSLAWKSR